MSTISRRRWLVGIAALLVLAAIPAITFANHLWGGYHWARTSNPFTLKLGDNVTSAWDSYLSEASVDWTASSVLNTTIVTGGTTPRQCKPTAGRIEICNDKYGFNGWLGIAQIWISGNHITQAIAKMNDSYFNTASYNKPEWRRLVMCQEIAHGFGLDHQDEDFGNGNLGTCMDYTNTPLGPPSNEHPNSHDYTQLESLYAHTDSTTTVGQALPAGVPPAMSQIVLSGVNQWGPAVRSIKNGRGLATMHELDFGNGNKVITHVFWALEGPGR
jgi:hypothetical protein